MRAYRALLRLFPASFRREYGDEMASLFGQRLREARGPIARAGLWAEAAFDTVASAVPVHVDLLRQDLRYSGRTMLRSPGFAVTAVLVAALGVGATTARFSIADHVLVRPLPFPAADRIVRLWQDQAFRGYAYFELSPANYRDWKSASTSFETMSGFRFLSANLVGDGEPERLDGASFTADVLRVLQVQPALGARSRTRMIAKARRARCCYPTGSGARASAPSATSSAGRCCSTTSRTWSSA